MNKWFLRLALPAALLLTLATGAATAQSLSIGPGGINLSTGNAPDDVNVRVGNGGVRVARAAPPPLQRPPAPRLTPPPSAAPARSGSRLDCGGRALEVLSNYQTVTVTGSCPQVTVRGQGNTVYAATSGPVRVLGGGNRVIRTVARTSVTRPGAVGSVTTIPARPQPYAAPHAPAPHTPAPHRPAPPKPPQTATRL